MNLNEIFEQATSINIIRVPKKDPHIFSESMYLGEVTPRLRQMIAENIINQKTVKVVGYDENAVPRWELVI